MPLTPSDVNVFAKLATQLNRGSWTDAPSDPNYSRHWNAIALGPGETLEAAFAATLRPTGGLVSPKNMATIRLTDQALYVDTPNVARVGALGSLAGNVLDRSGASTARRIPLSDVQMTPATEPNRINIEAPGVSLIARTDQALGRPADLSPGDQVRRLRDLFRR